MLMKKVTPFLWMISQLTALFVLISLVGCASSRLPPKLTSADQNLVRGFQLPYSVGVLPDEFGTHHLLEDLQASGVFEEVGLVNQLPSPDLLIQANRAVGLPWDAPQIPVWSLLTLGVVPTRVDEEHGQSFTLSAPGCGSSVDVDFSYQGKFTGGWLAVLINISTNYTVRDPRKTDRYRDGLALAIAQRSDEIRRLAARDACG